MLRTLLAILLAWSALASEDLKNYSVQQLIKLAEDVSQVRPNDVTDLDVSFYLYTRNLAHHKVKPDEDVVDTSKPTKILIHGWLENHKRSWYEEMTKEYLKLDDFNVVQVDWERVARSSYISSAENTKLVGRALGNFLLNSNLSLDTTHLIGHSLGAHVAAFASKTAQQNTNNRVARISALDPAGPYFREIFVTDNDRLNKNDAEIVDVVHTDGGFYGYESPIGTLDIYVNGGTRPQPGCLENFRLASIGGAIEDSFCSHARSWRFFLDSINKKRYTCFKCESWERYLTGACNRNEKYVISAEGVTSDMTGVCYVKTDASRSPIAKGLRMLRTIEGFVNNLLRGSSNNQLSPKFKIPLVDKYYIK